MSALSEIITDEPNQKVTFDPTTMLRVLEKIDTRLASFTVEAMKSDMQVKSLESAIEQQTAIIRSLESEVSLLQTKNEQARLLIQKLTENYLDDDL